MLVFAPLFWGGNRPLPLYILEVLGVLVVGWVAVSRRGVESIPLGLRIGWAGLVLLPLIQLVPLPPAVGGLLASQGEVVRLSAAVGVPFAPWLPISAVPVETEASLWLLVPLFAAFLVPYRVSFATQRTLLTIVVIMAAAQSVLGLLQFAQGPVSPWRFGNPFHSDGAVGTYANRNHLAGLLEMAIMVATGLCVARMQSVRRLAGRDGPGQHAARWWGANFEPLASYGSIIVLCAIGLVFTKSKAGMILLVVGFITAAAVFQGRAYQRVGLTIVTFLTLVLVLTIGFGLAPALERLLFSDYVGDARWPLFATTFYGALQGLPFGHGVGTFAFTYPPYQPDGVPGLANHAHNDYLEWFFEGGLPALALIALGLWLFVRRWIRLLAMPQWGPEQRVRAGTGLGLFLLLLHGLVDFNLRIPANAVYFSLLAGVFLAPDRSKTQDTGKAVRRTHRMPAHTVAPVVATQTNPFA